MSDVDNEYSHAHQGVKRQPTLINTYGTDAPAANRFGVGAKDGEQLVNERHAMAPGANIAIGAATNLAIRRGPSFSAPRLPRG